MSEIKDAVLTQEETVVTDTQISDAIESVAEVLGDAPVVTEETKPQTDVELLFTLRNRRQNGTFPVQDYTYRKLKELRTFVNNKTRWTGQQQAYYIFMALMDIENVIAIFEEKAGGKIEGNEYDKDQTFDFRAVTLEILDIFFRKHEAIGRKEAEAFLAFALPLNNTLAKVQETDKVIKGLEEKIKAEETAAATVAPAEA